MAPGILTFIRAALGTYLALSITSTAKYYIPDCVVVEGYGLTECAAPCTLTLPGDIQPGQVTNHGAPSGHVTPSSPLIGCRWGRPCPATWSSWRTWPRWSTSPRTARARSASGGPTCSRCWHLQNCILLSLLLPGLLQGRGPHPGHAGPRGLATHRGHRRVDTVGGRD